MQKLFMKRKLSYCDYKVTAQTYMYARLLNVLNLCMFALLSAIKFIAILPENNYATKETCRVCVRGNSLAHKTFFCTGPLSMASIEPRVVLHNSQRNF